MPFPSPSLPFLLRGGRLGSFLGRFRPGLRGPLRARPLAVHLSCLRPPAPGLAGLGFPPRFPLARASSRSSQVCGLGALNEQPAPEEAFYMAF